jgi:hypothetical protein
MKLNPQTTVLTLETTAPDYWHPRASGSSQTFEPLGKDSDDKTLNFNPFLLHFKKLGEKLVCD